MDRLINPICPEFAEGITQTNQVYVLSKQNDMVFINSRQDDIIRIVKLKGHNRLLRIKPGRVQVEPGETN